MDKDFDVIIIGGRLAGSVTTALLGRAGFSVLVLERSRFPSDTLSTHFFRAPALRAFEMIGALDDVLAAAPRLTVNYNAIDSFVFPEPVDRPEDFPFYMCLRRITLDAILFRAAMATPGVAYRQAARAQELLEENGRVSGVRWREDGAMQEAAARLVVGADGLRSFVAEQVNPAYEFEEPVHRLMYYAYFHGMAHQDGPAAEFHYRGNELAYVMPTDAGLTLLAISTPIEDFKAFKSDPEGRLMAALQNMPAIRDRLGPIERAGPVRGSGSIPGYVRVPYGPGWVLVGDSGMVMDPWSGRGIDNGASHAVLLAESLDMFLSGRAEWESAMAGYHAARNEASLKDYRQTSTFSKDLRPMTRAALEKRGLV